MKIFSPLYNKMMSWAAHRYAPYYLAGISFSEAIFFPIPPDVMLAPMSLAQPQKAWWFATLTTVASVLGGLVGYSIGMYLFDLIYPWLVELGYTDTIRQVQVWFETWGFWVLFLAGSFTPIPFKFFTIAGGSLHMSLLPFIIGASIGRGSRFYLVSGLMRWGGARMDRGLRRCIDWLGWVILSLLIIAYIIYRCCS